MKRTEDCRGGYTEDCREDYKADCTVDYREGYVVDCKVDCVEVDTGDHRAEEAVEVDMDDRRHHDQDDRHLDDPDVEDCIRRDRHLGLDMELVFHHRPTGLELIVLHPLNLKAQLTLQLMFSYFISPVFDA